MRVLSLHNFAKFGCFTSINDKIINNLLRWGRFQPNSRRPLAAKLWTGPKKVWDLKWWHGPSLSLCKIWWISRDARQRERMKCDFFTFLKITLVGCRPLWCIVELFPQDIASAFAGRFRWYLQSFFCGSKALSAYWTVFKIFVRGRYDWCPNGRKKFENLRKWM